MAWGNFRRREALESVSSFSTYEHNGRPLPSCSCWSWKNRRKEMGIRVVRSFPSFPYREPRRNPSRYLCSVPEPTGFRGLAHDARIYLFPGPDADWISYRHSSCDAEEY